MKRTAIIAATIAAALATPLQAQTPGEIFKEFSSAMAMVEFKMETESGLRDAAAPGFCVHIDQQGRSVFLTTGFGIQTRLSDLSKLTIRAGGLDTKKTTAEIMGVDPVTGMGFVRTTTSTKWTKVVFVGRRSGLKIGQQVVSIGLQNFNQGYAPYLGIAYVSGKVRAPETMYRVTGGLLTGNCSPVFNLDGKVVGIVGRQLPAPFQMRTPRGNSQIALTGRDTNSYFLPIDEFAVAISNIPSPTTVKRRVWTGIVGYHPVTDDDAKTYGIKVPAVMVGKVVNGSPAHTAGIMERDLIIGLNGRQLEKFPRPSLVGVRFIHQLQIIAAAGGKKASLTIRRGDKQTSVNVALEPIPKQGYEADRYISRALGMIIREKLPSDSFNDKSPTAKVKGVIVASSPSEGSAGNAGVRRGDLLIQIDGKPVTTIAQAKEVITKTAPGKTIILLVQRGDKTYPISVVRSLR